MLPASGADERDEPLLVLGGGSGAHMVDPMLTDRGLRSHYDVGSELIVVDQRGAGASEPALECRGAKEGAALTTEPDDADTMVDAVSDCRERLVADGVDLDGFNHTANADDLEMVHRAPGPSPHGPHVS